VDDEMRFGGYPNGRGPISEAVMPLNNVLMERAHRIRCLEGVTHDLEAAVRRQAAEIERKDAALTLALAALESHDYGDHTERAIESVKEALK
jgi:hypothetical protein